MPVAQETPEREEEKREDQNQQPSGALSVVPHRPGTGGRKLTPEEERRAIEEEAFYRSMDRELDFDLER